MPIKSTPLTSALAQHHQHTVWTTPSMSTIKRPWTPEECDLLRKGVDRYGIQFGAWKLVAGVVGTRSNIQVRIRIVFLFNHSVLSEMASFSEPDTNTRRMVFGRRRFVAHDRFAYRIRQLGGDISEIRFVLMCATC
jgi:hypothetical protein